MRFDAVLCDLLAGLLDSWSVWDDVAGSEAAGRRWRGEYLRRSYAAGGYRPYEDLVAEAARAQELDAGLAEVLVARWDELAPWPEAPPVLATLRGSVPVGVVTNCSDALGERAVARLGLPVDVVVTAEAAGVDEPAPAPYRRALAALGRPPGRVLFVAGSRIDVGGAAGAGMPVWWHNRIGTARGDQPVPLGEARTLDPLPVLVTQPS